MMKWIRNKFLFIYKYTGKWISRLVNCRKKQSGKPSRILLYCNYSTMEEHLLNYMQQLEMQKYEFYIYFGESYQDGHKHRLEDTLFSGESVKVLRHIWQMCIRRWDLIVCPDLEYPFWLFKGTIPLLYIGHGISNVSYDNGKTVYDYGPECYDDDGEFLFDKMLEPNQRVAQLLWNTDEKFQDVVIHTGYRFAGKIKEESEKGLYYREQLGITAKKPVVSFFGSWNRESLFHVLGEDLFKICDDLRDQYTFIFSIHPIEYREYNPDIKPLGQLVEAQREKGHIVRSPGEDWVPYMMSSDVVISDYSTMMSLAILAGKKVILSDFPDMKIGSYSLGYQVKKQFPVLKEAGELGGALDQVFHIPVFEEMVEKYRKELYVSSEEYCQTIRRITEEMIKGR